MSRPSIDCLRGSLLGLFLVAGEAWGGDGEPLQRRCLDEAPAPPRGGYDLASVLNIAQCLNPDTREAWERARQAGFAVDLVRSNYAPQVSIDVLGGFQRTPGPIPTTLLPRGYFTSNTRELIPSLEVK